MRKRHLNSDFIAQSSLCHLQKGPDGASIQIVLLRHTDRGLRCNGNGLYKEKNTTKKKGDEHFTRKNIERERERVKDHTIRTSPLPINEKPILRLARGRIYNELLFLSFILIILVLLVLSL